MSNSIWIAKTGKYAQLSSLRNEEQSKNEKLLHSTKLPELKYTLKPTASKDM